MDPFSFLAFAFALALSTASPGPTIAALLARVIGRGTRGIGAFCAGLLLGDAIWLGAAVLGLAALAETAQPLFAVLKWAGIAYLMFLAWRLFTAPAVPPGEAAPPTGDGLGLAMAGLTITLGNPKTMLFYTAVTPAVLDLGAVGWGDLGLLLGVLGVVYGAVLATYVVLAARARRLFASARAVKRMNQACGAAMAGAAASIATR
jgi:threonine/homoserine/homoserine lactone efflux protein